MVTVNLKITAGTFENPNIERHLLPVSAARAILGGVGGVDFNQCTTSVFSFVRKIVKELSPGRISDTFGKTMIMNHTIDIQVFDSDDTVLIDKLSAKLVSKVRTSVSYSFVDMRNDLASFISDGCTFGLFRHPSLGFSEGFLIRPKEAGIGDCLARRKSSETLQPNINTDSFFGFREWTVGNFATEGNKPLSSTGTSDTARLNIALKRTVQDNLNIANLSECNERRTNGVSALRIAKAVVPSSTTKTRVSRIIARFNPSEEGLKSKVNSDSHILKYLGVNGRKRWSFLFQGWQSLNLAVKRKRLLVIFPRNLTLFKKTVVKPATLVKRFEHKFLLFAVQIQSVLESSLMHNDYYSTKLNGNK